MGNSILACFIASAPTLTVSDGIDESVRNISLTELMRREVTRTFEIKLLDVFQGIVNEEAAS